MDARTPSVIFIYAYFCAVLLSLRGSKNFEELLMQMRRRYAFHMVVGRLLVPIRR